MYMYVYDMKEKKTEIVQYWMSVVCIYYTCAYYNLKTTRFVYKYQVNAFYKFDLD